MRFISATLSLLAVALPVLGAPRSLLNVEKAKGATNGKYIITLKQGINKASLISQVKSTAHVTDEWSIVNGFAAHLDTATLNALRAHSDVAAIAQDSLMSIGSTIIQTNAPWGLQRISQAAPLNRTDSGSLTFTYPYDSSAGGAADIYIVDTGIYTAHSTFQGRATWGATFGGYDSADVNGHGTHIAGIAAGYDYGVAKAAHLIAVKVLSDSGSGYVTDIVSGLNWVQSQVNATGRPSIVTMSLGGGISTSLDSAVASLTSSGIHVVVGAGNSGIDASNTSPARAPSALTVGASDITDTVSAFSNYGPPVKVYAPGVNVISSWIAGPYSTKSLSGTSTAAPHVSGIVAYIIGLGGNLTPANMIALVQSLAVKGILKNIPTGTVNLLAQY